MTTLTPSPEAPADQRSLYAVAVAVVQQVLKLCPEHEDEAGVWRAFATWQGRNQIAYFEAVQRTRHSLFHYELQQLIEFGIADAPEENREEFCLLAGRMFGLNAAGETVYPLLRAVGEHRGGVQEGLAEMVRMYFLHYTDDEFLLTTESTPEELILEMRQQFPERARCYFEQYRLDGARCFQHSVELIAGALDAIFSAMVRPYDSSGLRCICTGGEGRIHLPVRVTSEFAYDWLSANLLETLQRMQVRHQQEFDEHELQSNLVISSPAMSQAWERLRRASRTDETVLLLGESGTGKTFVAQKIHELSARRQRPFVTVALTSDVGSENLMHSTLFGHERDSFTGATERKQGLFSLANGGTILLDEVGDAPLDLQAKLLRVIETGTFRRLGGPEDVHVNVRIVAATHRDLERMVREGRFRADLLFRLNVIPIRIPALRERVESIPALTQYLFRRISSKGPAKDLAPGLVEQLQLYPWPGNIRELDHALRHAAAMADTSPIQLSDFPTEIQNHLHGIQPVRLSAPTPLPPEAPLIDTEQLLRLIRSTDPLALGRDPQPWRFPAHIDYARKQYLTALIEALDGDLATIGRFFDRGSEKTLRNLIRSFGLGDLFQAARSRERGHEAPQPESGL